MKKGTIFTIIAISSTIVIVLFVVSILNLLELNRITIDFLGYFNLVVTPMCLIVGLIISYPFFKKKLVEDYVSRQFEIMHNANRKVREECRKVINKFPLKDISENLDRQYIKACVSNIEELTHIAFDSNPDARKYSNILLESLNMFYENYPLEPIPGFYKETLDYFINIHVHQISEYAISLGAKLEGDIKEKKRLNKKLDKFVRDNKFIEIGNLDLSYNNYHTSQLLVIYFGNSYKTINPSNHLLYLSVYLSVPTPSPIARILYAGGIYLPPLIKNDEILMFGFEREMHLIGFSSRVNTKVNGEKRSFYICYYANIGSLGFVHTTNNKTNFFANYRDSYLGSQSSLDKLFTNYELIQNKEVVKVEIDKLDLCQEYKNNRKRLIKKFKSEM